MITFIKNTNLSIYHFSTEKGKLIKIKWNLTPSAESLKHKDNME